MSRLVNRGARVTLDQTRDDLSTAGEVEAVHNGILSGLAFVCHYDIRVKTFLAFVCHM